MLSDTLRPHRLKGGTNSRPIFGTSETGTMAAALAAAGVVWTLRNPEGSGKVLACTLLRPRSHTIVAFTTPITQGRGLDLIKLIPDPAGGTANPSSGAAWSPVSPTTGYASVAVGRVATTAALTTTGFTKTAAYRKHLTSHQGAANEFTTDFWRFGLDEEPIVILPGECLALQASQLFDAAGTWRLALDFAGLEMG